MPTLRPLPTTFRVLTTEVNYDEWEEDIRDHFNLYGVDSYIDGCNQTWPPTPVTVVATTPGTSASGTSTATTTTSTTTTPSTMITYTPSVYGAASCVEEWASVRRAMCGIIRSSVSLEVRRTIPKDAAEDPGAMIDELRKQFRKNAPMTIIIKLKNLLTSKKPADRPWDVHINMIMDLARAAFEKPLTLPQLTFIAIILSATPDWDIILSATPDWDAFMGSCMQQCPLDQPQTLRAMLRAEEDCRANEERAQSEMQALAAQFSSKKSKSQQPHADVRDPCTHPTCIDRRVQKTHDREHCNKYKAERGAAVKEAAKKKKALAAAAAAKDDDDGAISEASTFLAVMTQEHSPPIPPISALHAAGPERVSASSTRHRVPASTTPDARPPVLTAPLPMNLHDLPPRSIALAVRPKAGAVDSGSQCHFEPDLARFHQYELLKTPVAITCFTGATIYAIGKGCVRNRMGKGRYLKLKDVYHTPGAAASLISVGSLADHENVEVVFRKDYCLVRYISSKKEIARGARSRRGLYLISDVPAATRTAFWAPSRAPADLLTWHRRLGHPSMATVASLVRSGAIQGVHVDSNAPLPICEHCLMTKSKVRPYPRSTSTPTTECLERVGSDLCGPMRTSSLSGSRYALNHYDFFSHYLAYDFVRAKDKTVEAARVRLLELAAECGKPVRAVRTDNGGEFGPQHSEMLRSMRVVHETTAPESSAQNGGAERAHQTIARRANAMLKAAGLCDGFWAEAWHCATYLHNRTPSRSLGWRTPYELFFRRPPVYNRLAEFGCDAWVVLPEKERTPKQALKAIKCKFMGYYDHSKSYKCWNPTTHKMIKSRNVAFVEPKDYDTLSSLLDAYIPPDDFLHSTSTSPSSPTLPPSPSTDRARDSAGIDGVPNSQARAHAESSDDAFESRSGDREVGRRSDVRRSPKSKGEGRRGEGE